MASLPRRANTSLPSARPIPSYRLKPSCWRSSWSKPGRSPQFSKSSNREKMDEVRGWLFDVYDHLERGIILWIIADSGERLRLRMDFSITFYVAGDSKLLRAA